MEDSTGISDDVFDLFRVNLFELILNLFVLFELVLGFVFIVVVLFIFIFNVIRIIIIGIIIIHSYNPIGIMVDDSVSVLELKALETLLVCHVFDSVDDNIGQWLLNETSSFDIITVAL
jgi:hypothetical protein